MRYSWPRMRASRRGVVTPPACSNSRSPSRTQIVVWNDDRLLGGAAQFQPPSANCSWRSRSTSRSLASPKYAPEARTLPLIQGSTSPSKKGESPNSGPQVQLSRTRPIALRARSLVGSNPRSLSSRRVSVVEIQPGQIVGAPPHWPSGSLKAEEPGSPNPRRQFATARRQRRRRARPGGRA